jgi:ribonuclease BN (tRNA processing enzyme)
MEIKILGAHSSESKTTRCISFLIDNTLAVDAGALASSLSLRNQKNIRAILLTHAHFDHIRDIPLLALNYYRMKTTIDIYSLPEVKSVILAHLLNGRVYPEFQKLPVEKPTMSFHRLTPLREQKIAGYRVLAVPVNHDGNTVGCQVTDGEGKALFYTSDTGPGLIECWRRLSFGLLIIDTTFPDSYEDYARETGHLTPKLLYQELVDLREVRGDLPRVVVIHRDPLLVNRIDRELAGVAAALGTPITVAREGMRFRL